MMQLKSSLIYTYELLRMFLVLDRHLLEWFCQLKCNGPNDKNDMFLRDIKCVGKETYWQSKHMLISNLMNLYGSIYLGKTN